jgi:hypothetical protein
MPKLPRIDREWIEANLKDLLEQLDQAGYVGLVTRDRSRYGSVYVHVYEFRGRNQSKPANINITIRVSDHRPTRFMQEWSVHPDGPTVQQVVALLRRTHQARKRAAEHQRKQSIQSQGKAADQRRRAKWL